MDDPASLRAAFNGAVAVYSVQNGQTCGFEQEVVQGRNVADAANATDVAHLVYGSAGTGERTGVGSWDAKVAIEEHMSHLGLRTTVLRPMAFMELMTDKAFYPAVGTWRIWPKLAGDRRPIPWVAVDDLGAIAAIAFARPEEFVGKAMGVASDVQSLAECRALHRDVMGHGPRTFPMPIWLFDRFTRKDITTMWRWTATHDVDLDTSVTRAILPTASTVKDWLVRVRERSRDGLKREGA